MKRAPLQRDPKKVRAWNEKHRKAFAPRQGLERKPVARVAPKRPDPIPPETRIAARARSGGQCVSCLYRYGKHSRGVRKAVHLHHIFEKQFNRWPELAAVEDGLVGLCWDCHQDTHGSHKQRRVALMALPECVFRLAAVVGPAAVDHLLSWYPERGGPAQTT